MSVEKNSKRVIKIIAVLVIVALIVGYLVTNFKEVINALIAFFCNFIGAKSVFKLP